MRREVVAKRYAKALARVLTLEVEAHKQHKPAMDAIRELFANQQAKKVLANPVLPLSLKRRLLDYALSVAKASERIKSFSYTMLDAGRAQGLVQAFDLYEEMVQEKNGFLEVKVTSATPLSQEQLDRVKAWLEQELSKTVTLEVFEDRGLLGGLALEFGDKTIDLSVRKKLHLISKNLAF